MKQINLYKVSSRGSDVKRLQQLIGSEKRRMIQKQKLMGKSKHRDRIENDGKEELFPASAHFTYS